ncbi:MAG: hypothetical protein V1855_01095, partial [bacterium]
AHKKNITKMALLDNGFIVTTSDDCTAKIWNPEKNNPQKSFRKHKSGISSFSLLPDEKIVSIDQQTKILSWNIKAEECRFDDMYHHMKMHFHGCKIVFFEVLSPTKRMVTSYVDDETRRQHFGVWNIAGSFLTNFFKNGVHEDVICVKVIDGNIVTGSIDAGIQIWDPDTGNLLWKTTQKNLDDQASAITCLETIMYKNKRYILGGCESGKIYMWDFEKRSYVKTLSKCNRSISSLTSTTYKDTTYIISGSTDGSVCFWDVEQGTVILTLHYGGPVANIVVLPDERLAIAAGKNIYFSALPPIRLYPLILLLQLQQLKDKNQTCTLHEEWYAFYQELPLYLKNKYKKIIKNHNALWQLVENFKNLSLNSAI